MDLHASGDGLNGPDFTQQDSGYDSMGRQVWSRTGGGTILRKTFDYRGLTLLEETGTGLADGTSDNLVTTLEYGYDGNGQVVSESRPVDSGSAARVVDYVRDWRGRVMQTLAGESYAESVTYDNLNRATRKDRTDGATGALLSRIDSAYDDQGRLYRTTLWNVSGGYTSNPVTGDIWYDGLGRQIKTRALGQKSWTRTEFNSLGWTVASYFGYPVDGVLSGPAGSVTGDYVAEQTLRAYRDDGTPRSSRFNDIYRSRGADGLGGLAQSRHVFLSGCGLLGPKPLWHDAASWTILETGFGLGLNFLATWKAWRDDPHRPRRLHYVALELDPVQASDLLRSVSAWPELQSLAKGLSKAWWGLVPGLHTLSLNQDQVRLTLAVGDAEFQKKCLDRIKQMQNEGRSIILVTHDTSTVENFCDSAVVLDHGKLLAQGDTKSVVAAYQALP